MSGSPGRAVFVIEVLVGGFRLNNPLPLGIPLDAGAGLQGNIGQVCERRGTVAGLEIAIAPGAGFHAIQEIADVLVGQIAIHGFKLFFGQF